MMLRPVSLSLVGVPCLSPIRPTAGTVIGRLVHQGQRRHDPHCPLLPSWKMEAEGAH